MYYKEQSEHTETSKETNDSHSCMVTRLGQGRATVNRNKLMDQQGNAEVAFIGIGCFRYWRQGFEPGQQ